MADTKTTAAPGTDWTHLLTDPEVVAHLGKLLQTYRESPPEKREQALLSVMREIKENRPNTTSPTSNAPAVKAEITPTPASSSPPFEPDLFSSIPSWGQDRRRFPRLKCFVAVELNVQGCTTPIWGNLSNTSLGGCFVETATPVPTGVNVEIGLWLANGKIWVKGLVLTGIVTSSSPSYGVRVKFGDMDISERESFREFLKFIEGSTRKYHNSHSYLAELKR